MAFQVSKTFVVQARPPAVWAFLIDPRRVAGCLPGAAITDKVDDKTYTGEAVLGTATTVPARDATTTDASDVRSARSIARIIGTTLCRPGAPLR